ncbi:MAG: V-type ATPase 116kDa subunit family protein [Deinococcales bacterium]
MITAMDQLTLVGPKTLAKDLLVSLQNLGVVHVDPVAEEGLAGFSLDNHELSQKEAWEKVSSKAQSLLDVLGIDALSPAAKLNSTELGALEKELTPLAQAVESKVAERADIRDELEVISSYLKSLREVAPSLARFDDSRYLSATAFMVPSEEIFENLKTQIAEELPDKVVLAAKPYQKAWLATAAMMKSDQEALSRMLGRYGLAEIKLPDRYAGEGMAKAVHHMEERSQKLPRQLEQLEADLAKLARQHGETLQAISQVAQNEQGRYDTMNKLAASKYGFALQGWLPSDKTSEVVASLKKQYPDVVIESRHADEHHDHDVPVSLNNPNWVKPFQGLLSLFAPPKYGSFDPSWTLAVFFPFFFGLVVGDIGFGLLFLALGLWMKARGEAGKKLSLGILGITINPGALGPISTVMFWCAGWSILWGVIFGEFFGNFLEHWPHAKPIFFAPAHSSNGFIPISIFRVEQFTPMLLTSIGFGVLQVLGGWALRTYYGIRHHDKKHTWEGIGMFAGLLALVVFATAYLRGGLGPAVTTIVIIGLALFVFGVIMSGMPLMLIELISNGGAILSYLRLFAVGLSAAIVANLATDLGFAIGGSLPVIGPILGILVGLAVHLIAMALTIIGHTLQPLRLHYVEFFTKFGFYDENGRPYKPFHLLGGKS